MTTLRAPTRAPSPGSTRTADAGLLADVALPLPLPKTFAYAVPPSLRAEIRRGARVAVPFGSRSLVGFVVGFDPDDAPERVKPIQRLLDPEPLLDQEMLDLAKWIAERTLCSWGEAIRALVPGQPAPRRERVISLARSAPMDLFAESAGGSLEDRIVAAVSEASSISLTALAKSLGMRAKDLEPALRALARANRLRWTEQALGGAANAPPRIKIVRLAADMAASDADVRTAADREASAADIDTDDAALTRAPVQARCIAILREAGGALPLRDLAAALPGARAALKRLQEKGVIRLVLEEWEGHNQEPMIAIPEIPLNDAQAAAVEQLHAALASANEAPHGKRTPVFLLHGVTGSGKTEVYLRAIQEALRYGKQTIFLVPEITLTPQTVSRLRGRFGGRAAVLHSRLTDVERRRIWHGAKRGDYDVVLGARSAVFAPLPNLGLIVIDEEHDAAYKQEDAPRYVARDVAVERARRAGAVVLLGSATPDVETYARTESGEIQRLRLPERVANLPMPPVRLVDLRGTTSPFSKELLDALALRLERREQTILFLNRRGFSPFVQCIGCGTPIRCDACAVSLTYHKADAVLRCHYCDASQSVPTSCPSCHAGKLAFRGSGTQRIEEELRGLFPAMRLARLDSDSVRVRGAHEQILGDFLEGEIDVLLGTQMVAKGLDFPRVTLVGVLNADTGLHLPDYRAAERTFQLLAQVAGRAGRSALGGEVIVQTRSPEHVCFAAACAHDDEAFRGAEMAQRRSMRYPPFSRLGGVLVRGESLGRVEETANWARDRIAERIVHLPEWAVVLGPATAPLAQLRGKHRMRLLVKASRREDLLEALAPLRAAPPSSGDVEVLVDVDPASML